METFPIHKSHSHVAVLALTICLGAAIVGAAAQGGRVTATTPRKGGNPEAAKLKSPIAVGPESIAAGRRTYQRLCSRCHGPEGRGDGGGAGAGGRPADFTDETWEYGGSDGEIFTVIRDGTSPDMESYAEQLPEPEIWQLVSFLRTLKAK